MRATTRFAPCALAEIGRCTAPCDGRIDPERYGELVRGLLSSLTTPAGLLGALEDRMRALAEQERFEEAAAARDRLRAVAEALARDRAHAWLLSTDLVLRDADGRRIALHRGSLVRDGTAVPVGSPCPRERADEVSAVRSRLGRGDLAVERVDGCAAEPVDGGAVLAGLLERLRR
jgi:hypothetical protein